MQYVFFTEHEHSLKKSQDILPVRIDATKNNTTTVSVVLFGATEAQTGAKRLAGGCQHAPWRWQSVDITCRREWGKFYPPSHGDSGMDAVSSATRSFPTFVLQIKSSVGRVVSWSSCDGSAGSAPTQPVLGGLVYIGETRSKQTGEERLTLGTRTLLEQGRY